MYINTRTRRRKPLKSVDDFLKRINRGHEEDEEDEKMETKSRYEVIGELEQKKRTLIMEREGFADKVKMKEKEIRDMRRDLEDAEIDLEDFKASIEDRKKVIAELIESMDEALKRFDKKS